MLAKSESHEAPELLDRTLYSAAEVLRILCGLIYPVLPDSVAKIWEQLGFDRSLDTLGVAELHFGHMPAGQKIREVAAVFPRIEAKPAIARMRELEELERARQDLLLGKPAEPAAPNRHRLSLPRPTAASVSTISSKWICV